MPFHLILTPAGTIEATIGLGAAKKTTTINWQGAPWPRAALGHPRITSAIEGWFRSRSQPQTLTWQEVQVILQAAGVADLLDPAPFDSPVFSHSKGDR